MSEAAGAVVIVSASSARNPAVSARTSPVSGRAGAGGLTVWNASSTRGGRFGQYR